jgi:hypothetical protein
MPRARESVNAAGPRLARVHVDQVRGVLAERLIIGTHLDPYLSLRALSDYCCLSIRTLRHHLQDMTHPLPHFKVGGKVLVRRSHFDAWIATYARNLNAPIDGVVDDVLRQLA